jgi:prevent-host-death family protein
VKRVNIQEAKTHLSRLLEEAAAGAEIIIAKAGRPYVRLVPCLPENEPRVLGGWEGKVRIDDDFDDTPAEVIAGFEGPTPVDKSRAGRSRRRK